MNTSNDYTDEQIQTAIDAAFLKSDASNLICALGLGFAWKNQRHNRLAIARDFLAALPERPQAQPGPWPGQQEAIDAAFAACEVTPLSASPGLRVFEEQASDRLAIAQAYDAARPQAAEIAKLKDALAESEKQFQDKVYEIGRLLDECDKAQGILKSCLSVMPFGNIETHTFENLPGRISDLTSEIASLSLENERLEAELAALRQPILADDGRSLGQVAFDAGNAVQKVKFPKQEIETWEESAEFHEMLEAAAQAVADVVLAQAVRRMEEVPKSELQFTGIDAIRARLIAAAKGEGQAHPVVGNEPDLSGESEKPDPYARLKAYNEAGARIRCGNGPWRAKYPWCWACPPSDYEVHPDDLHMVPEYAPAQPMESPQGWTLPVPPTGFRWHREDWTADMLPEGWRPLLDGEAIEEEDEFRNQLFVWRPSSAAILYKIGKQADKGAAHFRTRRPLPTPSAEPPKAQEAEQVVYRNRTSDWSAAYEEELLAAKPWTPRPGEVVRLKSGGPEMTVRCFTPEDDWVCNWFYEGESKTKVFPVTSLQPVKEDAKP